MFERKCLKCGRKISREYDFCPHCGNNIKREIDEREFGLLGKNDKIDFPDLGMKMPFGFNRIFSSLVNQLDKQFKELDKEIGKEAEMKERLKEKFPGKIISKGFSISIATSSNRKPEIRVRGFGPGFEGLVKQVEKEEKPVKIKKPEISDEKAKKLAKLPREEAETQVRRFSNKIIYEIDLPGVSSLKDILINQLENSIEIKAFSKDKVYFKLLPINLPIINYKLEKEKLILELKAKD